MIQRGTLLQKFFLKRIPPIDLSKVLYLKVFCFFIPPVIPPISLTYPSRYPSLKINLDVKM